MSILNKDIENIKKKLELLTVENEDNLAVAIRDINSFDRNTTKTVIKEWRKHYGLKTILRPAIVSCGQNAEIRKEVKKEITHVTVPAIDSILEKATNIYEEKKDIRIKASMDRITIVKKEINLLLKNHKMQVVLDCYREAFNLNNNDKISLIKLASWGKENNIRFIKDNNSEIIKNKNDIIILKSDIMSYLILLVAKDKNK